MVLGALAVGCSFTTKPMIPIDPDTETRADSGLALGMDASTGADVGVIGRTDTGASTDRATPELDAAPPTSDAGATGVPDGPASADVPRADVAAFDLPIIADAPAPVDASSPDAGTADAGTPRDCSADDGGDGGRCDEDAPTDASTVDADAADQGVTDS